MRNAVLILLISTFQVFATGSYSQTAQLSLKLKDATIKEVLTEIENQSEFYFLYNSELIDVTRKVDISVKNEKVNDILSRLFSKDEVNISISDRHIVLTPVDEIDTQQQNSVSGKVTDKSGQPMPGVTVVLKGTATGTVTNADGNYTIKNIPENAVLQFSFVGMKTQETEVGSQTKIDVSLEEDAIGIEEVVAIGYGTVKKKDITGAISQIKAETLQEIPATSIDQAMNGRASGVQILTNSGAPGGATSIRIRGVGTVNNAEPLYVVDGIPINNTVNGNNGSLSSINPSDIESIEVLKDASALAIYGARAQNGVIIINSKQGAKGALKLDFDSWVSMASLNNNVEMLSGQEWAKYYNHLYDESELLIGGGDQATIDYINGLAQNGGQEYDWLNEVLRKGITQNYQVSGQSGNEISNYYFSANYLNQTGIFENNSLERYSLRFNSTHKPNKWFTFGNTMMVSRTNNNYGAAGDPTSNTQDNVTRLIGMNPFRPIYDAEGNYAGLEDFPNPVLDHGNTHPVWRVHNKERDRFRNRLLASLFTEIEIVKGLKFKTMGSTDLQLDNNRSYDPYNEIEGLANVATSSTNLGFSNRQDLTWTVDNTLNYLKSMGDHNFNALLGHSAQSTTIEGFSASGTNFLNNDFPYFGSADNTIEFQSADNNKRRNTWVSFFGRLIYDYKGKYLATATLRRDGSSRFGVDSRWGNFPSFSVGWRMSEESFMSDFDKISNLKLRAGWGITGGESAGDYQYLGSISSGGAFNYAFDDVVYSGATFNRLPNRLLQWEETEQYNYGLDLGLFKNRVEFTAEYFIKNTNKLFLSFLPPVEAGLRSNPNGNLGEIQNKGFELTVNTVNTEGQVEWTSSLNFTTLHNEVVKLAGDRDRNNGVNITRVGEEIGALYGYVSDGIFQNWEEVYAGAYQNQATTGELDANGVPIFDTANRNKVNFTAPGDIRFKDLNGDGIIEPEADRQIIGSTIPNLIWGLSNTVSYKGFAVDIFFQGIHGVDIYNELYARSTRMSGLDAGNMNKDVMNRWTGEGTSNKVPRPIASDPNTNNRNSDRFVESGAYVRLKNIRLSYNLPAEMAQKLTLRSVQLYFTATNLLTFSSYSGFDPEIGLRSSGMNETAGTDNGNYPLTSVYTFGLKIGF